jgi:hypothetical protein
VVGLIRRSIVAEVLRPIASACRRRRSGVHGSTACARARSYELRLEDERICAANPLAAVEDFDRARGDARPRLLVSSWCGTE